MNVTGWMGERGHRAITADVLNLTSPVLQLLQHREAVHAWERPVHEKRSSPHPKLNLVQNSLLWSHRKPYILVVRVLDERVFWMTRSASRGPASGSGARAGGGGSTG